MLPYLRPSLWDKLKGDAWYQCPMEMYEGDKYYPNVSSLFLGIVRTRTSWDWWMRNKQEYLMSLVDLMQNYMSTVEILDYLLQPVLHFYETAYEHKPHLCYSRLRALWMQIMEFIDPECNYVTRIIQRWCFKYTLSNLLKMRGYVSNSSWEFQPPFAFLKDVVETYKDKSKLYKRMHLRIYSDYSKRILNDFPGLDKIEAGDDSYIRSNYDTMTILSFAPHYSSFNKFYTSYLLPRIKSRVNAIYNGFGMFENKESTVHQWRNVSGLHTVGFLVMEHIKENKDALYA